MLRNFKLYVEPDYKAMSLKAAEIFAKEVKANPMGAFGFATGSSPVGMYKALSKMNKAGQIDMSKIRAYNLDEYHPIGPDDPQSYRYFMRENLFESVGIAPANAFIPDGTAKDPLAACAAFEEVLSQSGGIVMQILGIGTNGHIGFNEPAENLHATTNYVPLAKETLISNSKNFNSPADMPKNAITMGMHSIMMAKRIILLASGEGKAEIMQKALYGPISTMLPASLLQLHHDVTVVADSLAARLL